MIIRKSVRSDIKALTDLSVRLIDSRITFFKASNERITSLLSSNLSDPSSYMLTVENDDGVVSGGALVVTRANPYAEKMHCQIIGVYTECRGSGAKLVHEILEWFESRRASLLICYAAPIETDLDGLLLKNGFERQGTMLVRRRYNGVFK